MGPSRRSVLAHAIVAVLLLAQSALADGPLAEVQAAGLAAWDAATSGELRAVKSFEGDPGEAHLSAAWVHAVYEQESGASPANQSAPYMPKSQPTQEQAYTNVTNGFAALHNKHQVYVLPLRGAAAPAVRPETDCAALRPSVEREVHPAAKVVTADAHHKDQVADVTHTVAWDGEACVPSAWTVEGDFLLTLWDADIWLPNDNGTATYRTGAEFPPEIIFEVHTLDGNRTNRQLYLEVHGGRLELRVAGMAVYLAQALVEAASVRLDAAVGTVDGQSLSGVPLDLEGSLVTDVRSQGNGLAVTVRGRLEGGSADGTSFTVAQAAGGPSPWLWSALLAVPVLAGAMWRLRPEAALARFGRGLLAGRKGDAPAQARRLEASPDLAVEATALRVEALARAGRTDEALAVAGALPAAQRGLAAALAHGFAGDVAAGVHALAAAPTDPVLARLALLDPTLAAAWPALRRWLDGSVEGSA